LIILLIGNAIALKDVNSIIIAGVIFTSELVDNKEGQLKFEIFETIIDFIKVTKDNQESRKIGIFFMLNLAFMFIELAYGYLSNSLGLVADSFHMLFDSLGLFISLVASYISKLPPN